MTTSQGPGDTQALVDTDEPEQSRAGSLPLPLLRSSSAEAFVRSSDEAAPAGPGRRSSLRSGEHLDGDDDEDDAMRAAADEDAAQAPAPFMLQAADIPRALESLQPMFEGYLQPAA